MDALSAKTIVSQGKDQIACCICSPSIEHSVKGDGFQKHLLGKQMAGWSVGAFEERAFGV